MYCMWCCLRMERGEGRDITHMKAVRQKNIYISMDNEKDNLLLCLTLKISFTFITANPKMSKCDRVEERGCEMRETGWTDANRGSKKACGL